MRGLVFEGQVLTCSKRSYDSGVTDTGKSFPAGETVSVELYDGKSITRAKVSKDAVASGLGASLAAAAGTSQVVALTIGLRYGKLEVLRESDG